MLSDDEKINLALIGSVPNHGIKQVRIHWLFNLIFVGSRDRLVVRTLRCGRSNPEWTM
jgi:hypothetical protein